VHLQTSLAFGLSELNKLWGGILKKKHCVLVAAVPGANNQIAALYEALKHTHK